MSHIEGHLYGYNSTLGTYLDISHPDHFWLFSHKIECLSRVLLDCFLYHTLRLDLIELSKLYYLSQSMLIDQLPQHHHIETSKKIAKFSAVATVIRS